MTPIAHRLPRPAGPVPGIAIVGAGEIVRSCHMPAYRMADFPVVALCDRNVGRARALGEEFAISSIDLEQILRDDAVGIVDIAVPVQAQPEIALRAVAAGKHILCQKPLALCVKTAGAIADAARSAGVLAAVNHQMRYAPAIAAARDLVGSGAIGTVTSMTFDIYVRTPWEAWPFWFGIGDFEMFGHSIHYLDTVRHLLGMPDFVYANRADAVGRHLPGPIRTHMLLGYPGPLRARIDVNHDALAGEDDWRTAFRIEGTAGILDGSNGALFDYPHGRGDSLRLYDARKAHWTEFHLEGRWFPDAFAGTMGELLCAIEEGRAPSNSVADGVETIRLVTAASRSAAENRPIRLTGDAQAGEN